MQFILANTFQDSLAKLQPGEQQAAKIATLELQMNPAHPGLQVHKLDRARDRNFWSARVNDDLRLILHRMEASMVFCYVAHHDAAYQWAERRKLTVHPVTGAMQLVNLQETVQDIVVPRYVPEEETPAPRAPKPLPLLAGASDAELLSYGVPVDWLKLVRQANEDSVLEIVEQLPDEAREAVLLLATGTRPAPAQVAAVPPTEASELTSQQAAAAFAHPDAQRRFRSIGNVEELKAALEAPWEKWAIFLHPAQRTIVERDFSGPARVTGSAGTGKTIVALHRAVHLAETYPSSRVLLTSFNEVLVRALEKKLRLLIASRPRLAEQIEVLAFEAVARRLYESNLSPLYGPVKIANPAKIESLILETMREGPAATSAHGIPERFVIAEWHQVIDAAQLRTWESYRDHTRAGRRSRLREPQRAALWSIFELVFVTLEARREMTVAEMFVRLAGHYRNGGAPPFDFAVVDEAQDVSQAELRCFAALGGNRPNALFFAGDTAQRIFQTPFSWKANGVEIRGRSTNLKVNYRTSQEIRERADRLLDPEITDGDGNAEQRLGTLSVFNGPDPEIRFFAEEREESRAVGEWIKRQIANGTSAGEIVLFVRSTAQLPRAEGAAKSAGLPYQYLTASMETVPNTLCISPMQLAKGLEFRAVAVMACDEDSLPDPASIAAASDSTELQEIYMSERQLLYVACTRARDALLVSSAGSVSEFVDDMSN